MTSGLPLTVSLKDVYLDEENPRFEAVDSEDEAIEKLCLKEQVLQLADDIVAHGLSPAEKLLLLPDEDGRMGKAKTYIVAEGNRRVCALKLLDDPDRAPAKFKASFKSLAKNWDGVGKMDAVLFQNRDEVNLWLERIHGGAANGRGRRSWDPEQAARHTGKGKNQLALAVLDYAEDNGFIQKTDRRGIITTAQRYLGNASFREALGLDASDIDNLKRTRPKAAFDTLLEQFFSDLLDKTIGSRDNRDRFESYGRALSQTDGIAKNRIQPTQLKSADGLKKKKPGAKKKPKRRPASKITNLPYDETVAEALEGLGEQKLVSLYNSVTFIKFAQHTPLLTVGLWSLIESLAARAGSTSDFQAFFSKNRVKNSYGLGNDWTDISQALRRISELGNTTKHHKRGASYNGEQLANDLGVLRELILKAVEEAQDQA